MLTRPQEASIRVRMQEDLLRVRDVASRLRRCRGEPLQVGGDRLPRQFGHGLAERQAAAALLVEAAQRDGAVGHFLMPMARMTGTLPTECSRTL